MKSKKSKDRKVAALGTAAWLSVESVRAAAQGITPLSHMHIEAYFPINPVGHAVVIVNSTTTSTQG